MAHQTPEQLVKQRFFLQILPLLLLVLLLGGIGGMVWLGFRNQTPLAPRFDAPVWQGARGARMDANPRYAMVADLQRRYLHRGMNYDLVLGLLGPADYTLPALCYRLGSGGSLLPIAESSLCIIFDANAQVRETWVEES